MQKFTKSNIITKFTTVLACLIFSFIFVSCNSFLPENYKKIKQECNLSKIMSPINHNASPLEIIGAEIEVRFDRAFEIQKISKGSISIEKRAELQAELVDMLTDVENLYGSRYAQEASDIFLELPVFQRIQNKMKALKNL